jgi:hypothetical protein
MKASWLANNLKAEKLRPVVVMGIGFTLLSLTLPHVHDVLSPVEKSDQLSWAYAIALEVGIATASYMVFNRDVATWARGLYLFMLVGCICWSYALNFLHYLQQGADPWFAGFAAAMLPASIAILSGSLPGLSGETKRKEEATRRQEEKARRQEEKEERESARQNQIVALSRELSEQREYVARWQKYSEEMKLHYEARIESDKATALATQNDGFEAERQGLLRQIAALEERQSEADFATIRAEEVQNVATESAPKVQRKAPQPATPTRKKAPQFASNVATFNDKKATKDHGLSLLKQGKTAADVATKLGVSTRTVQRWQEDLAGENMRQGATN